MKKRGWREIKFNKIKIKHKKLLVFWNIFFKKLYIPIPKKNILTTVQSLSHDRLFVTQGLQHARPPCPSPTPRACSNSCPLSQRCHPTILCSVTPFSSCPQSFRASDSFQMSHLFLLDGQSIGASVLASVLPMNIQGWFPLGLTGLISLQSKEFLRVFSNTIVGKHLALSLLYSPTLRSIHDYWEKHSFD